MAINVGDAVLKITGDPTDLNQALRGIEGKVQSAMQKMQTSMRMAGVAFTALGAAGLKMVDNAREMNAQLGVTGLNLGITTKEMRDLALEVTNVTFPLKEVTASFDLLARAGVKDTEILKATATAFDTLGDAVGRTASDVTSRMVPAMKTFGLSATEVADKTDMMTYLMRNTTVSLDNFGSVIGYITPELVQMGLTLDDTIALMALMEMKGMSGEVATRAFRTAITQATREQVPLNETLGITNKELEEYKKQLEGATGMTQKYADEANKQYGIMDRVKQKFDELVLVAGSFLAPLEPILALMTALGPIMLFLSTQVGINTVKWVAHTVATKAATLATNVFRMSVISLTLAMSGLAAGIGLLVFGIMQLIDRNKMLAEVEEINTKLEGARKRALDGTIESQLEYVAVLEQAKAVYGDLGSEVDEYIEKVKALAEAQKEHNEELIEKLKLEGMFTEVRVTGGAGSWYERMGIAEFGIGPEEYMAEWQAVMKKSYEDLTAWEKWAYRYTTVRPSLETLPEYQHGGLITKPTLARLGEAGPEMIVPLSKSGQPIIQVTLHNYIDGREVGSTVIDHITEEVKLRGGM